MKCVSASEVRVIEETISSYDLTKKEVEKVLDLVEKRAMDVSLPFKFDPYNAAHVAASTVIKERN